MEKRRFVIKFTEDKFRKPLTYHLIKEYDLKVNILRATITEGQEGRLLVEIEAELNNIQKGINYLKSEGVNVIPIEKQLNINSDNCIHCGACTAVCFSEALTMDTLTWEININKEKCVACGLCVKACPIKVINIGF